MQQEEQAMRRVLEQRRRQEVANEAREGRQMRKEEEARKYLLAERQRREIKR